MSAVAVIPAFNEEASLGGVLAEIAEIDWLVPVVVDDGSSDGTAGVARNAGVACVRLPFNLGVGGAVRTGLRWALEHDAETVVIVDADGQHDPADVAALLSAIDAGAGLAIGSRFAADAGDYAIGGTRRRADQHGHECQRQRHER